MQNQQLYRVLIAGEITFFNLTGADTSRSQRIRDNPETRDIHRS